MTLWNVSTLGRNETSVPRSPWPSPTTPSGATATPSRNSMKCSLPCRQMRHLSQLESALTTETPTPCSPPETLYEFWSNLPPAWSSVITISAAELLRSSSSLMSVGMPRPLSTTEMELSVWITTLMSSQWPANASSIALSTTSKTMWWSPVPSDVSPMYMPGRLRTASRPLRILMLEESYSSPCWRGLVCA